MTHHDVATARRLKTVVCISLALTASACATSRPSGSSQPTTPTAPAAAASAAAAPAAAQGRKMATSPDGTKIAYDMTGTGPFLIMLHGGGYTARGWADREYVTKLKDKFTLVTPDQRGTGDSDKPTGLAGYALDKMIADVLAVADAAGATKFHLWGFGHGATIARYIAARSDRVISTVLVSADFGPPLGGIIKDAVTGMRAKWQPFVDAQIAGTLDLATMSASDRAAWDNGVAVSAMALGAMLDYPPLEPSEIKVPTLWLIGAGDTSAMENVKAYEPKLAGTQVTLKTIPGATYTDTFGKADLTINEAVPFLTAHPPPS